MWRSMAAGVMFSGLSASAVSVELLGAVSFEGWRAMVSWHVWRSSSRVSPEPLRWRWICSILSRPSM